MELGRLLGSHHKGDALCLLPERGGTGKVAWKRGGRRGGTPDSERCGRTDSTARIVFDGMVRLLGSTSSTRSRNSSRDLHRQPEDPVKMSRQLTKRFRWCFGPPDSPPLPMERRPLTIEDGRALAKPSPGSPHPSDPALEECHTSTEEGTSKTSDRFSDLSDGQIELDSLEPTEANFSILVAECYRLRNEKTRLQHMLLDFDGQMERLTRECEEMLNANNSRFEQALRSVKYMDTVVKSLREELDNKVHSNTELELERNVLQHQLAHAMEELRAMKDLRSSAGVIRVKEAMLTPTF